MITAYDTINQFFDYYLNQRNLEKTLSMVSNDIYSIGTGDDEIAIGKHQFAELLRREIEILPNSIQYKILDYREKNKHKGCFDCFFKIEMVIQMPDSSKLMYHTRFTSFLCDENGKMLIESIHMSDASYHHEEKLFPTKFESEKIKGLNKNIQHKQWEIFYQMLPSGIIGGYIEEGFPIYIINEKLLSMARYDTYDEFVKDIEGLVINSIYEDDRQKIIKMVNESLKHCNQYEVEYRMKTKDGGYIWIYHIGTKTTAQDGRDVIVGIIVDISSQVKAKEDLIDENAKDSLTGIYNRKGAEKRIADDLKVAPKQYIFMMVDLDNFKKLNDYYGHTEGDKALCFIANKLQNSFRKTDTVCRIGGDEFAVYISSCSSVSAIEEKVKKIINDYIKMIEENYPKSKSSVSFGGIYTDRIRTFNELYKMADSVLYEVKKSNKGTFLIKEM